MLLQLGALDGSLHRLAHLLVLAADGAARLLRQLAQTVSCDLHMYGMTKARDLLPTSQKGAMPSSAALLSKWRAASCH